MFDYDVKIAWNYGQQAFSQILKKATLPIYYGTNYCYALKIMKMKRA